jgi:hypothetical protein
LLPQAPQKRPATFAPQVGQVVGWGAAAGAAAATLVPQLTQKALPGGTVAWQVGQVTGAATGSGWIIAPPHLGQN